MLSSVMAPTVFSLIFAICFVLLTSLLPIRMAGEIKDAVTTRFLTTPWQLHPTSTVENVHNGVELYQWLTEVFVSQLYAGYPINGDADGYCTEQYPCLLDEGDADAAAGCARGLVLGEDNCPSWMVKMDCCEPCIGDSCDDFYWHFDTGVVAETTSVPDVSANCAEAMPSWLDLVDTVANLRNAPVDGDPDNTNGSFPFCPERTGRTGFLEFTSGGDRRPVTVGEYNRAVMGRLTLKRFKFSSLDSDRFVNAYPTRIETSLMSAYSNSDAEEKGPFGASEIYTYSKDGGFRDTGGYVIYFDFARSEDVARNSLYALFRDYWFDMSLGSFVWEVLFYNANANLFIHVSFIFEQRFTGLLKFHIEAAPLDLTLHEVSDWETWLRYILFTIIILLLIFFAKNEVDDMSTVGRKYFLNTFNLVHLATLGLTVYLLVLYFQIILDYRYVQFEFPMVNNVGGEEETFRDLVNLANEQMNYNTVISITTCLIFSRCISLLASLAPSSGAIFNTFYQAKYNILSAFFILAFFFMGFTFCSWVLLSTRGDHFNDLPSTITSHITMVMGFSNYEAIVKGDNAIALPYFCVFHLVWLVIKQLLLSIIICGYFREKSLMRRESNKYPLRRFLHTSVATLREWLSPLLKGIVTISNLLFGSSSRGGTVRVNYEQVGKLKDRRTTKPRMRSVEYERKGGDSAEQLSIKPSKDIELEARPPYFRNGHMHYYVKSLGEGPAKENAVLPNERLVSITKHDRKDVHFRDRERFETTYGGDASKILPDDVKDLPVVLEFEGYVKPVTLECIGLLVFVVVYSLFVTNVARTEEVQNMRMLTERHLWDECWYEYNPERVVCFDDIMDMSDVVPWIENAVLEMEYGCATPIDHPDCSAFDQAVKVRDGWIFWAGAYGSRRYPRADYPPLGTSPHALAGYSAGYVAWRDAWAEDPAARQPVEVVPRAGLSNIGVMPQNHMRMTIQITCFKQNTFTRTEKGIPFVLFPEVTGRRCADDDCQKSVIETGDTCRNLEGTHINPSNVTGAWSKIPWIYSEMSSYGEHGGIAIGLGSTRAEAGAVLVGVSKDRLLSAGTASVVIDWVSYNGELDLFTYKQVLFSVADSGKMFRELRTTSFALNLFSAGPGEEGYRYFNVALCIAYMVCAVMFTFYLIQDLFYVQYQITTQLQRPWYMFVPNFFQEDWWNFVDVVSVCLNISVIYRLMAFMLYQGSFNSSWHVLSWVITDFQFRPAVNDRDRDEFSDFYEAAKVYENFLELAAINGMFLLIRCMKYFGAVPPLRLIMQTLSAGLSELLNLSFTLLVLLFSFVLLFFVQYGVEVQRVSTFHGAFVEMFLYLVGSFNVWDLFEHDPIYFTILLLIYTVLFGFLLTNIFLAVIVWQWQEVRKDAQNKSVTDLILENMGDLFECFAPFVSRRKEQEKGLKMLDKAFWQKQSAIQFLEHLDERGALRVDNDGPVHTKAGAKNGDGDAGLHHPVEDDSNRIDLGAPGGRERFEQTFRRAHMEIASTMCRAVPDHALDIGAGVASVLSEDEDEFDDTRRAEGGDAALAKNELQSNIEVPMLDLPVEENRAIQIEQRLRSLLSEKEQHQHCDEIWLDCLITVLEDVGALGKLQDLFRPPPMHKPKKEDDKAKFENEKLKMQKRLDRFLSMCKEETRKEHYKYLKVRAAAKDRVLKQQSIYLAEYLAELNQGIVELNGKIDTLGKENARMRTHVTPLL